MHEIINYRGSNVKLWINQFLRSNIFERKIAMFQNVSCLSQSAISITDQMSDQLGKERLGNLSVFLSL